MDLSTHVWLARFLPKGRFARNVGILTGGTVFAQGMAVLATPILTRLYTPADFNPLAVYVSTIGLLSVVASLRYNIAIPLPERNDDAINLLALSCLATLAVAILAGTPIICSPEWVAGLLGYQAVAPYLWMAPIGVFLASSYDALQYWATRNDRMALVTRTRVTRALFGPGTQLAIGAVHPSPFGLIFGHMIYCGMGTLGLARSVLRDDRDDLRAVSLTRILSVGGKYVRFPLYSVPEALLNTASVEAPVLIITAFAAGPEAAHLMLAMRVMGLPMGLIGSSVAQVFLAEAPQRLREGTLSEFARRTMWALFLRGAPIIASIGVAAPFVFPFAFGDAWARAGVVVAWTTPWFILQFVASPVSMLLNVVNRMRTAMLLQLFGCVTRVGLVAGAALAAPGYMTETYAISGAVFYLTYVVVLLRSIPQPQGGASCGL
jgi:O-antigen/teichoic acid export membrane protein